MVLERHGDLRGNPLLKVPRRFVPQQNLSLRAQTSATSGKARRERFYGQGGGRGGGAAAATTGRALLHRCNSLSNQLFHTKIFKSRAAALQVLSASNRQPERERKRKREREKESYPQPELEQLHR